MTLNPHPTSCATVGDALRLHWDARPAVGYLAGRIPHVASGHNRDFARDEPRAWCSCWLTLRHPEEHSERDSSHSRFCCCRGIRIGTAAWRGRQRVKAGDGPERVHPGFARECWPRASGRDASPALVARREHVPSDGCSRSVSAKW